MMRPIVDGSADYVNGSRILGEFERESLLRHLGVHLFARIVTVLTGRRITTRPAATGPPARSSCSGSSSRRIESWTSEILIEALRHRARVVEVPVTIVARAGGESKKPASLRYGWSFSKVIVQTWLR